MAALAPVQQAAQGQDSRLPKSHSWRQWLDREAWRKAIIAIPYLWLLFFFIVPFLIVVAISAGTSPQRRPLQVSTVRDSSGMSRAPLLANETGSVRRYLARSTT